MREKGYAPDHVVASDAARTMQTAWRVFPDREDIVFERKLYHASPDTILSVAKGYEGCLALIGHNPGIAMAASGFVGDAPEHPRFDDYPTGATTVIDFDGAVGIGGGRCVDFVVPRDLE